MDESKLLVYLVPQYLAKNCYVVVSAGVFLYARDDVAGCLDSQTLQAVFLIEIGKEILVHCFPCQLALEILLVKLQLRVIDLFDGFLELLQSQIFVGIVVVVVMSDVDLFGDFGHFVEVTSHSFDVSC